MNASKSKPKTKRSEREAIWNKAIDAGLVVRFGLSFHRFLTIEQRDAFLSQAPEAVVVVRKDEPADKR